MFDGQTDRSVKRKRDRTESCHVRRLDCRSWPKLDSHRDPLYNPSRVADSGRDGTPTREGFEMTRPIRVMALSIWPGVAQIWFGQEILGLLFGVFFASALNVAVVGRWIWFEAFAPGWTDFFAYLAAVTWLASLIYTLWWVGFCHPDRHRREIDQLFREAQEAYLQGHWNEARRRIERILAMDESDADALMQLGTLYLRIHQPGLARRTFRQCLESHGGVKWRWEIQQCLSRLTDEKPHSTTKGASD